MEGLLASSTNSQFLFLFFFLSFFACI